MGNLYQVFSNKFEKQQVEMNKLTKRISNMKRSSSSSKVLETSQKEKEKKPNMSMFNGLVKSIEKELNELEKKPLDQDSLKEAINDLDDIQFD